MMKEKSKKERLDVLVTNRGLAPSREKAKALIMAGQIFVNGNREDKAGTMIEETAGIEVKGQGLRYVSRGGLKLEKAIQVFPITLTGKTCMDVGASTGGFTDCMLQNGAERVYSIDVGRGQLAWKLRCDERVINLEKTNMRYVTRAEVDREIDFASIDVSFISLKLILPVVKTLLADTGEVVCLVKPQFEAGKEKVGKKGVVREPAVHAEVLNAMIETAIGLDYQVAGLSFSPVKGPEGNIEYLLYLQCNGNGEQTAADWQAAIIEIVEKSHQNLDD
ncbi:MAG: TlyA family RNA methyltransferase [Lachnospiraceae bacterium]|nr:TlyA family RNA methyltransferase [Lachnospiraceae bacterium]MDY5742325.1 TlyA family RNA methyltransferase [Lachnospiraceae bacterium]